MTPTPDPEPTPKPDPLPSPRVVTINLGNRRDARVLKGLKRLAKKADMIGWQEGADREKVLRQFARESGYRLIYGVGSGRARTGWLVAPGFDVTEFGWTELSPRTDVGNWGAGPKVIGRKWIAWVRVRGALYGVVHFVPSVQRAAPTKKAKTGRRKRRALWDRQMAAVIGWMPARGPVLVVGDFNATPNYKGFAPLRQLLTLRTRPSHGKRRIDHHWFRGMKALRVWSLLSFIFSDHKPVGVDYE